MSNRLLSKATRLRSSYTKIPYIRSTSPQRFNSSVNVQEAPKDETSFWAPGELSILTYWFDIIIIIIITLSTGLLFIALGDYALGSYWPCDIWRTQGYWATIERQVRKDYPTQELVLKEILNREMAVKEKDGCRQVGGLMGSQKLKEAGCKGVRTWLRSMRWDIEKLEADGMDCSVLARVLAMQERNLDLECGREGWFTGG